MEKNVVPLRHLVLFHLLDDLLEFPRAAPAGEPAPGGEIDFAPALRDIARYQPRHRRDSRVPRPARLVGMAVVARTAENLFHIVGRREVAFHRRIDALHRNELNRRQSRREEHTRPHEPLLHRNKKILSLTRQKTAVRLFYVIGAASAKRACLEIAVLGQRRAARSARNRKSPRPASGCQIARATVAFAGCGVISRLMPCSHWSARSISPPVSSASRLSSGR